jgi:DNA-binding transcriptional regulator YhcF (GntR family)
VAVNRSTNVKTYKELAHEGVTENRQVRSASVIEQTNPLSIKESEEVIRKLARQL